MLARYMLSSCVCPSVRLSITSQHCIKMAKRSITKTTPYDSPGTLVFCCLRTRRNPNGSPPKVAPNKDWIGSNRHFSTDISLYLKNGARIATYVLCNANRNSYAFCRMALFLVNLSDPKPPHFWYIVSFFISSYWVEIETSNLVHRLIVASVSPRMTNHP